MRSPLAVALAGTFLTAALFSGSALGGPQDKCTCKHLDALRAGRTEAQKMYAYEKTLEKQLIEEQAKIAVSDAGYQEKEEGYKNFAQDG